MKKILQAGKASVISALFVLTGFVALVPATVSAQGVFDDAKNSACQGAQFRSSGDCSGLDAESRLNGIMRLVINILSVVAGFAAVIMIILAGFKYITSEGDSGNIQSAKTALLYAIIGLVVVALAQFIVRFVLAKSS